MFAMTCGAAAQPVANTYPTQTVRIVVPFSAGSITDGLARVLADELAKAWKQSVIVENRPGIAGTASVAKSAPDGYTLMLTSNGHTIASVVNKSLPYDPAKDFAGVTPVATVPQALIIPPDLSAKTLMEWVALARSKPGEMNFSSAGLARTSYLGAELLKQTAKLNIVHIPQRGAPEAITSVMRGESQLFFLGVNIAAELHTTGKIRAMAVATSKRSPALPDVPTVAEAGYPGFDISFWVGFFMPKAVPAPIRETLHREIVAAARDPAVQERLESQGVVSVLSPADYAAKIAKETTELAEVVAAANIKAE